MTDGCIEGGSEHTGSSGAGRASVPGPKPAVLVVLVSLLLCLTLGTFLQRAHLLWGIIGTELLCLLVPLAVAVLLGGFSPVATLRLRWPGWGSMGIAVLMAPAAAVLAGQVFWLQGQAVPVPAWYEDMMETLARSGREVGPGLGVLGLSVLPALFEEGLFRGFVLSGLGGSLGGARAVWVSAVCFAVLHLDPFRFVAVTLLGAFLGYLVLVSRSLYPAIVVHAINNALVLVPEDWAERTRLGWLAENQGAPVGWILASAAVLVGGSLLLARRSAAGSSSAGETAR